MAGGDRLVDCGNGGGGGACLIFDSVPEDSIGDVVVENVVFNENSALVGGSACSHAIADSLKCVVRWDVHQHCWRELEC